MTNPTTDIYGSLEVQFDCALSNTTIIELVTDIIAIKQGTSETFGYYPLSITLTTKTVSSITYSVVATEIAGSIVDKSSYELSNDYDFKREHIRIFISSHNISVYVGDKWVYSYVLAFVDYVNDPVGAYLQIFGDDIALYDIKRIELHDYRDAVYIDYEATADSALQSVIQERPVQIFAEPIRELSFTYHCIKDTIYAHHAKTYSRGIVPNSNLSSDGLIYYTNVNIQTSQQTADEVGFVTRLYRLSNLENGARQATKILQKLALERRYPFEIRDRFDPRPVVADMLILDKTITGTGSSLQETGIIEDVSIQLQDGQTTMTLIGRKLKSDE